MKYLSFVSFFYTVFKEQAERVFFDDSLKTEQYSKLPMFDLHFLRFPLSVSP